MYVHILAFATYILFLQSIKKVGLETVVIPMKIRAYYIKKRREKREFISKIPTYLVPTYTL
jgi:hypothetical protein